MVDAGLFLKTFVDVYKAKEKDCRNENQANWKEIWTNTYKWSMFMLDEENSVIKTVAKDMKLACARGEPLRLDAIFTTPQRYENWDWFPILAAIEHENEPNGFHGEIKKLVSVQCGLKVGITYALYDGNKKSAFTTTVKAKVERDFLEAIKVVDKRFKGIDQEYLFIIGEERADRLQTLVWNFWIYNPKNGEPDFHWMCLS